MVGLLASVAATLIAFHYQRGRAAAIDDAAEDMRIFTERLVERFQIVFADTVSLVRFASNSEAFVAAPPDQLEAKVRFLQPAITASAHIDGAYVGYPNGAFLHVVDLADSEAWRSVLGAPPGATTAIRVITGGPQAGRSSQWSFRDAAGKTVRQDRWEPAAYDPRPRPWYRSTVGHTELVATAPYAMATTGALALTVAAAHHADRNVVVGVDVLLDTISRFLADQRISPESVAFILDDRGTPIIHSNPSAVPERVGWARDERTTPAADPVVAAAQAAELSEGKVGGLDVGGREYIAMAATLDEVPLLKGDRIVIAAPLDELTAEANRALLQGAGLSALILAAGIGCALLFAQWISRSLYQLTLGVHRLQQFDFETPIEVGSRVREISALAAAMTTARATIRTFGLYVPKELVRRVIASGQVAARSAQRHEVTALFTDIYDFTTISERHAPEDVVTMLSAYFDVFSDTVAHHNGAIIQFLGDSVFAMWNVPIPDPHHAEHACRCAIAVKNQLDDFNAAQRTRGLPEFRTRFGIHTGSAVVGNVGAKERLQYTGMGDTVNVASRLEGMNKIHGTTILVSAAVVERCSEHLVFRPLGRSHAKGRVEDVEVFELVQDKGGFPEFETGGRSSQ
jgi:adenylate cyclase